MLKILKNLKESLISVIIIVILLCLQAGTDLALPDYTSKIVNIGIQQGGIQNVSPEAIRKEQMENLLLFSTDDEKILNCYTLISKKEMEDKEYEKYKGLLCPRITIVHAHSSELEKYYKDADICSIYFPQEEYRNFVMPIKLFEYIGNVTPIIATANTATGNFVEENDIGWAIANDNELEDLFEKIYNNREELLKKYYNLEKVLESNTWEKRAQKVADDLKD